MAIMSKTKVLRSNKHLQILQKASEGRYGVLAAIAYNVEHILAFVKAAEAKKSPLIIQLFPWAIHFSDGLLVHTAAQAAQRATVPISIHLDHCQDEDLVKQACELPFDSIMIDMSHHPKAENLAKTRELVEYCHAKGKATEAEPGRIEGGEDGISDTADLSGVMTTREEAIDFSNSGVDCLAPAFGNVHGEYGPRGIVLEFDRLNEIKSIASESNVFIALHGVHNFPRNLMEKLVDAGVNKVNVNRDILEPYYEHVERRINKVPFTQLLEESVDKVADCLAHHMDVVSSTGKA